ncbi:MAG: hypothetical protein KTR29_20350 [Rhodothermaceae bacterium]|nr:hypothetical protein [Rhodothermaceae bacterium]
MIQETHTRSTSSKIPIHLLLGIWGLYLFRFGYAYGFSDQDEFLPYLMHLLDASLFTQDWFVGTQLSSFSIRAYFVYLLLIPAKVVSIPIATGLLYVTSWFATASGIYILALHLSKNRIAAIASVALALVMTPFWTLGGNDLVHSMLVPSMLGWSLGIWSVVFFIKNRVVYAALLLGLATLFQALVGLQLGLLLGAVMSVQFMGRNDRPFRDIYTFSIVYLVSASPALVPLFYQQFNAASPSMYKMVGAPSLYYIMAEFRNPHHYLFHSFDMLRASQFALLSALGLIGLFFCARRIKVFPTYLVSSLLIIIGLICIIAYFGTETYANLTVAKLQLFKLTVFAKVLLIISACAALVTFIPKSYQSYIERYVWDYPARFILIYLTVYALLIIGQSHRYQSKVYPFSATNDPFNVVYDWARTNTADSSVFAVPPSWSGFRSSAQRGIVINHKAFPYKDGDIVQWYTRLESIAPTNRPARTDRSLMAKLDSSYEHRSTNQIEKYINTYHIDYLVRGSALDAPYSLVFKTRDWYVYDVTSRLDEQVP